MSASVAVITDQGGKVVQRLNAMPTWTDTIIVDGKIVAQRSVTYERATA